MKIFLKVFFLTVIVTIIGGIILFLMLPQNDEDVENSDNSSTANAKLKIPKIYDLDYSEARKALLESGWIPEVTVNPDDGVPWDAELYEKYPELIGCSGTGYGFCEFLFISPMGQRLGITTIGNDHRVHHVSLDTFNTEISNMHLPKLENELYIKNRGEITHSGWIPFKLNNSKYYELFKPLNSNSYPELCGCSGDLYCQFLWKNSKGHILELQTDRESFQVISEHIYIDFHTFQKENKFLEEAKIRDIKWKNFKSLWFQHPLNFSISNSNLVDKNMDVFKYEGNEPCDPNNSTFPERNYGFFKDNKFVELIQFRSFYSLKVGTYSVIENKLYLHFEKETSKMCPNPLEACQIGGTTISSTIDEIDEDEVFYLSSCGDEIYVYYLNLEFNRGHIYIPIDLNYRNEYFKTILQTVSMLELIE